MDPNRLLGITPVNMRLAFEYLSKGVGWHPISHALYDRVQVSVTGDWKKLPEPMSGVEYGALFQVSFYNRNQRVRHINFSALCTGGGGEPMIRVYENDDDSNSSM